LYEKIHIIGGAGSGKTTLANLLSDRLGFPNFDLDKIGWRAHQKVPLDARLEVIDEILSRHRWITEGVFLWWTYALLEVADVIVWLDIPFRVAAWRIFKRHIIASIQRNNPHPGIINLFKFLHGVGTGYYKRPAIQPESRDDDFAITRAATEDLLKKYPDKVAHCRNQGEADKFLRDLWESS
jgi:adenylate kinase family enzyme